MKKLTKTFYIVMVILMTSGSIFAGSGDFTATITTPVGKDGIYFVGPQKSKTGFSVTVSIKNNIAQTVDNSGKVTDDQKYTITFDEFHSTLQGTSYNITYPTNASKSIDITGGSSSYFTFTFTPSTDVYTFGTMDYQNDYSLILSFKAVKTADNSITNSCVAPGSGYLYLWVDDLAPVALSAPTVTAGSTTLTVWTSYYDDDMAPNHLTTTVKVTGGGSYNPTNGYTTITGLNPNTSYTLSISCKDKAGNVSTTTTVSHYTSPAAPTNLSTTAISYCQQTLTWNASAGATGYYVYRNGTYIGNSATTSFVDKGLSPATTYIYYVVATNNNGQSDLSSTYPGKTLNIPTPEFSPEVAFMCSNSSQTINIKSIPGSVSYTWSVDNTLSINGESAGQPFTSTPPSVTIHSGSTYTNGTISVYANLSCGTSTIHSLIANAVVPVNNLSTPSFAGLYCQTGYLKCTELVGQSDYPNAKSYAWELFQQSGSHDSLYYDQGCKIALDPSDYPLLKTHAYIKSTGFNRTEVTVEFRVITNLCGGLGTPWAVDNIPYCGTSKSAIDPTNVDEIQNSSKFELYPNPTTSLLNVKIPKGSTVIRIFSNEGKQVYIKNLSEVDETLTIPINLFNSGLYFVNLIGENSSETKKIEVIKK